VPDRDKDPDRHDRVIAYLENVGSCFPIGAVARIFQPGCKLDTLPLLVSPQNYNKSKALAAFVPDPAWFTDDVPVNVADRRKPPSTAVDHRARRVPQIRRATTSGVLLATDRPVSPALRTHRGGLAAPMRIHRFGQ
jgi:hypothetical protein